MLKTRGLSLFLFVFLCCYSSVSADDGCPVANTTAGRLRGKKMSIAGKPVCQYLGIPFARPPLGDLRFREPRPYPPWEGIRNATEFGDSCAQLDPDLTISEDCLFLNIWTPVGANPASGTSLAVLFWIYGGSFVFGSTSEDDFNGAYMAATEGIIFASANYRLGAFGFLYLGDEEVPGNMGLIDQHFALRWVYDNIGTFGGNREKITLVGESSGAASVQFHLLAQRSWPFINGAILQSGSAIAPWAFRPQDVAHRRSVQFAEAVGCNGSVSRMITCLRSQDMSLLVEAQKQFENPVLSEALTATIDANWFLTDDPQTLTEQGKVKRCPLLLGSNSNEGTNIISFTFMDKLFTSVDEKPLISGQQFRDAMRDVVPTVTSDQLDQMQQVYSQIIRSNSSASTDTPDLLWIDRLDAAISDFLFYCSTNDLADSRTALNSPTFMYHFDHRSSQNPYPTWMGVMHYGEVAYVFGVPFKELQNYTQEERVLSQEMVAAWSSFVKTGYPTAHDVEWPEYSTKDKAYVHLVTGQFDIRNKYHQEGCRFWNATGLLRAKGPPTTPDSSKGSAIVAGWLLSLSVFIHCSRLL